MGSLRRSSSAGRIPTHIVSSEAVLCPKCQGGGAIALMHRYAGRDDLEVCPSCRGRGLVPNRNSSSDPSPALIASRVR